MLDRPENPLRLWAILDDPVRHRMVVQTDDLPHVRVLALTPGHSADLIRTIRQDLPDPRPPGHATWRTSSRSATHGQCVEMAQAPTVTGIRDSKNPTEGRLILTAAQ